jgi:hypothetical protein
MLGMARGVYLSRMKGTDRGIFMNSIVCTGVRHTARIMGINRGYFFGSIAGMGRKDYISSTVFISRGVYVSSIVGMSYVGSIWAVLRA